MQQEENGKLFKVSLVVLLAKKIFFFHWQGSKSQQVTETAVDPSAWATTKCV